MTSSSILARVSQAARGRNFNSNGFHPSNPAETSYFDTLARLYRSAALGGSQIAPAAPCSYSPYILSKASQLGGQFSCILRLLFLCSIMTLCWAFKSKMNFPEIRSLTEAVGMPLHLPRCLESCLSESFPSPLSLRRRSFNMFAHNVLIFFTKCSYLVSAVTKQVD